MCGIAGSLTQQSLSRERVEECLTLMQRRGPDGRGWRQWQAPQGHIVTLLSTRLAIRDLDHRADQPFGSLVFNGEIYNDQEIKRWLLSSSSPPLFTTTSDTEVLYWLLRRYGREELRQVEGMFAFAYYDEVTGEVLLGRDRFGEKPLYYYYDETGFYFGSEAPYLSVLTGKRFAPNLTQVRRFLASGYRSLYKREDTWFTDVHEVDAATTLTLAGPERASWQWRAYWQRYTLDTPWAVREEMTYREAVVGVQQRLVRAVERHLRADVPLACSLSGGIDSQALLAIATQVCGKTVHAFHQVDTDARYTEQAQVEQSVQVLGVPCTMIALTTEGFLSTLRHIVRAHAAPVYTRTSYLHWLLMEAVHSAGYKVIMSGIGADELFAGYFDHALMYLAFCQQRGDQQAVAQWRSEVLPGIRNPLFRNPALFVEHPEYRAYLFAQQAASLLTPIQEPFLVEQWYTPELLRNRMLNELFTETVPVVLHEDDLNAMYWSVENRSPFLDRQLVEFAQRIPTQWLIQQGRGKAVLRDAVQGLAPACILDNPRKIGWNCALESLLDLTQPETRAEVLADSPIYEVVKREKIQEVIQKQLSENESKFLFSFLSAKCFLEEFA